MIRKTTLVRVFLFCRKHFRFFKFVVYVQKMLKGIFVFCRAIFYDGLVFFFGFLVSKLMTQTYQAQIYGMRYTQNYINALYILRPDRHDSPSSNSQPN